MLDQLLAVQRPNGTRRDRHRTASRLIARPETTQNLQDYFGLDASDARPPRYTGAWFERLGSGGDHADVASTVTAEDLIAVECSASASQRRSPSTSSTARWAARSTPCSPQSQPRSLCTTTPSNTSRPIHPLRKPGPSSSPSPPSAGSRPANSSRGNDTPDPGLRHGRPMLPGRPSQHLVLPTFQRNPPSSADDDFASGELPTQTELDGAGHAL